MNLKKTVLTLLLGHLLMTSQVSLGNTMDDLALHNASTKLLVEYDYDAKQLITVISKILTDHIELKNDVESIKQRLRQALIVLLASGALVAVINRETIHDMIRG